MSTVRLLLLVAISAKALSLGAQNIEPDIQDILIENRRTLGLTASDLAEYAVSDSYTTARLGVTHVYLEQRHMDIPVHNGILNLNIAADRVLSSGSTWISGLRQRAPSNIPGISPDEAITAAALHLEHPIGDIKELSREKNSMDQDVRFIYSSGDLSRENIRAHLVWLQSGGKEVLLCWRIEIHETDTENVWLVFIDAHSGGYVMKENLVDHCEFESREQSHLQVHTFSCAEAASSPFVAPDSSYNVFAMPVESPNHGSRSVVTTPWQNAGPDNAATTLRWHSNGTTDYTITRGNNVHAYEDVDGANNNNPGLSPDTANLRFDYPFDPNLDPEDNMSAAITNLFYWNNIIHDVLYQYGFDEVSGNFQVNNLGRGGQGSDDVRAEGLDGGGTNNANFFTPADGSRPRMQMYLWSQVSSDSPLTIHTPDTIAGEMWAVESAFSNQNLLEDVGPVSGNLVLVEDDGAMTHEACGDIANGDSLIGKIAVIDRGNCDFVVKVKNVQNLGAIAAIVVNNIAGSPFGMGGTDNTIIIPAVMISLPDGNLLKNVMDTSIVNITLEAVNGIIPDGDYDNGIITHEYGHGVSNRLTGGPSAVSCLNNDEQMGEGWSDYLGLMLTTDWSTAAPTDRRGIGTYVLGEPTDGDGIRTYPYTTDMEINPFTYADIENAPVGSGGPSPHYIGSVWCTMLWDMTWRIIEMAGANTDIYHGTGGNNIALQLVIDGMKLQPCGPGFVDGRDAILLADQIRYGGQYSCAIWEAFAARGLGVSASQGSTNNHLDGVESFDIPTSVFIESRADTAEAGEGQMVSFRVKTTCGCSGKNNIEIDELLSEDLSYIPNSGGSISGDTVRFTADTLSPLDSLVFTYRAFIEPCSAFETSNLSSDNAEGPDQYESIKLAGIGTKQWVKSSALSESAPNSWYGRNYSALADFALTLMDPVEVAGPVEIAFDHRYETEADYDGGVVEYSVDDGTNWMDLGDAFVQNGYPSSINTSGTNSPIAGRDAFTGDSDVQFDTSDFIKSIIHLNLNDGQSLLLRFRFVCDGGVAGPGINGWYLDNIKINQLSGVTNQTRVYADGNFEDSLYYSLRTTPFNGEILFVDRTAIGNHSGTSWENAFVELPFALELAGCRDADSMFVASGIYKPDTTGNRAVSFRMTDSTLVFGGFPTGGGSFGDRDPELYQTVFSGDIGTENDNIDNSFHVLTIDSAAHGALVDGVTIRDGNADGAGDHGFGSGIFCEGGLTLQNVLVSHNTAILNGQQIICRSANGHLRVQDCTIVGATNSLAKLLNANDATVTITGNTVFLEE